MVDPITHILQFGHFVERSSMITFLQGLLVGYESNFGFEQVTQ
jgi:hypothetical protein